MHTVFTLALIGLAGQLPSTVPAAAFSLSAPGAPVDVIETAPQSYTFAGTRWGASIDETRKVLAEHGFEFEEQAEGGDLVFLGQLNDRPAIVIALFGEHGLSKVLVSLPTDEDSTMAVYREMRKVLGGEYGAADYDPGPGEDVIYGSTLLVTRYAF